MGSLEEHILQCLIIDGRAPYRRIGAVLGVSEQTVARRYRKMVEAGQVRVFAGLSGFGPNRRAWWVRIRARPDAISSLAEALATRPDVGWVALMSGGSEIACRIAGPVGSAGAMLDGLPRAGTVLSFSAQVLLRLFAPSTAEWTTFDDPLGDDQVAALCLERPRPGGAVATDDDAPLVGCLARDGRASIAMLSRQLAWPTTRVASRLEALLGSGALHVSTDYLPEAFGYHASAHVHLTVPPGRMVEVGQALAAQRATGFVAATSGSANLMAAVTCRSYDDLFRYVAEDIGALGGVQDLDLVPYHRRLKLAGGLVVDGRLRSPAG